MLLQATALMEGTAEGQKSAILPQVLEAVNARLQAEGVATGAGAPAAGGGEALIMLKITRPLQLC